MTVTRSRKSDSSVTQYLRAAFLCCQLRDGGYHCHECGTYYERPRDLRLARLVPGRWTPSNAVLLGSGPDTCGCYERAES